MKYFHDPAKNLKILQVCSSLSWGGMEMHVLELSHLLQQKGHQVTIITHPDSRLAFHAVQKNLSVELLRFGGYFQPGAIVKLVDLLKNLDRDVIHCHFGRDLWTLVPALKMSGKRPLVFTKHIGTQKPKRDIIHRFLYKNVDFIIANSHIIYQNILATHPVPAEKVGVIHLGIDEKRFYRDEKKRCSARQEFAINEDDVVFGITGRLQCWKGHFEFLRMASELCKQYHNLRFLVIGGASVGEEKEAEDIFAESRHLQLGDKLVFTGFREDIDRLLNALDVFVFPSYAEAYGLALLEAMAVGLPVIASNCDGVLDIVIDGENGMLVPPKDSAALIRAAQSLEKDKSLRQQLGQAAYRHYKTHFTASLMIEKLERLYGEFTQ